MNWRNGLTVDDQLYRRRRPSAGAIHRTVSLSSGSRFIAALLAMASPSAGAEQESGGV
jgi:hypothetical protein